MSCLMHWLPQNLRDLPIYQEIDELVCYGYSKYADSDLLPILQDFSISFRDPNYDGETSILDWYSIRSWADTQQASWDNPIIQNGVNFSTTSSNMNSVYGNISPGEVLSNIANVKEKDIMPEGMSAWLHFLLPYVGTTLIQQILLKMMDIPNSFQYEWYQKEYPIDTYGFIMTNFPGWEKTKVLIQSSKIFKNVESELYTIQDDKDYRSLIWDDKEWDLSNWDSPAGVIYDGVLILFNNDTKNIVDAPLFDDVIVNRTSIRGDILNMWVNDYKWDSLRWDDDIDESVYSSRTSVQV